MGLALDGTLAGGRSPAFAKGRRASLREGIFRRSGRDGILAALALLQGVAVLLWPSLPLLTILLWWNSNTIAHNFIHCPFFRSPLLNHLFRFYLTLLLGVPQTLWRERHLAHHGDPPRRERSWRPQASGALAAEAGLVLSLWSALLALAPAFFLLVYLPAYGLGLAICALHGRGEHRRGTTSHYGRLYNFLFFNDGYHVEHHQAPGAHWSLLPGRRDGSALASRWPAPLRWIDPGPAVARILEILERAALRSKRLRGFLLDRHERAFRRLLAGEMGIRRALVVGGGLFPRTALVLRRVLPGAEITVIDEEHEHLEIARAFLQKDLLNGKIELAHESYDPLRRRGYDLVVLPLAFRGDRAAAARRSGAPIALVHEWIWRHGGEGEVVSLLLLKRLHRAGP